MFARLVVVLAVAAVSLAGSLPFSAAEQTEMVNNHNTVRGAVNPPAASMPNLVWDATVAARAQSWSDNCTFAHNTYGDGQNLYVTSASTATATSATTSWAGEVSSWIYAPSGSDSTGGVVGHYTQMIWAATTKVGCGRTYCSGNLQGWTGVTSGTIVTCNYQTPGNYRNQYPYVSGASRTRTRTKTKRTPTRTRTRGLYTRTWATQYVCGASVPDGQTTMTLKSQVAAQYALDWNCTFLIHSTAGCNIRATFTAFATEQGFDFLRIYNGQNTAAASLAAYSGTTLPAAVTTTQPYMFMFFNSDYSTVAAGWTISITPVCSGSTTTRTRTKTKKTRTRTKTKKTRTRTKSKKTRTRTKTRQTRTRTKTKQTRTRTKTKRTRTRTVLPGVPTRTKSQQTRTRTNSQNTRTRTKTKQTRTRTKTKRTRTRTKSKRTRTRTVPPGVPTRTKSKRTRTRTTTAVAATRTRTAAAAATRTRTAAAAATRTRTAAAAATRTRTAAAPPTASQSPAPAGLQGGGGGSNTAAVAGGAAAAVVGGVMAGAGALVLYRRRRGNAGKSFALGSI